MKNISLAVIPNPVFDKKTRTTTINAASYQCHLILFNSPHLETSLPRCISEIEKTLVDVVINVNICGGRQDSDNR